jgi:hypothetical protein
MKRLIVVAFMMVCGSTCRAQGSLGEIQGVYLRIDGFTFNSGTPYFNVENAHINGGGYAIVTHITRNFGIFHQMGFMGSVEQNGIEFSLFNEFQGIQVNRSMGPLILYAKGGMGFTRFNFLGAFYGSDTHFAVNYGGGAQIKAAPWLGLVFEATRVSTGLPNLFGDFPDRNSWDHFWQFASGLALHF